MDDSSVGAVEGLILEFQQALVAESDDATIVERFLLHGHCYALDESAHYEIMRRIAQEFGINVSQEMFIVGSAKLGFSISPTQRWKHFDDESDVDIAIVSHQLFQAVWHEVYDYTLSGAYWPDRNKFQKKFLQGWIRPDLLPNSPTFDFVERWWDFFRSLKAEQLAGPYKIAAALYHDLEFLKKYQASAVAACRGTGEEDAD